MTEDGTHEPGGFRPGDLSDDWSVVLDTSEGQDLERELHRETPVGHVLSGRTVQAVAVRRLRKEVVFWLPQDSRWSVVHLTWAVEAHPEWPSTMSCDTWLQVVEELTDRGRA